MMYYMGGRDVLYDILYGGRGVLYGVLYDSFCYFLPIPVFCVFLLLLIFMQQMSKAKDSKHFTRAQAKGLQALYPCSG